METNSKPHRVSDRALSCIAASWDVSIPKKPSLTSLWFSVPRPPRGEKRNRSQTDSQPSQYQHMCVRRKSNDPSGKLSRYAAKRRSGKREKKGAWPRDCLGAPLPRPQLKIECCPSTFRRSSSCPGSCCRRRGHRNHHGHHGHRSHHGHHRGHHRGHHGHRNHHGHHHGRRSHHRHRVRHRNRCGAWG